MAMSVGVKAALIGAGSGIIISIIGAYAQYKIATASDRNKEDSDLLRSMVREYAKCGCKIKLPSSSASNGDGNLANKIQEAMGQSIQVVPVDTNETDSEFEFTLENK